MSDYSLAIFQQSIKGLPSVDKEIEGSLRILKTIHNGPLELKSRYGKENCGQISGKGWGCQVLILRAWRGLNFFVTAWGCEDVIRLDWEVEGTYAPVFLDNDRTPPGVGVTSRNSVASIDFTPVSNWKCQFISISEVGVDGVISAIADQ